MGSIGITLGKPISGVPDLLAASGSFTIDARHLHLEGQVSMLNGFLGQGSASVDINWATGVYQLSGSLSMFDGAVNFSGSLTFDNIGDITLDATASVCVPKIIPIIGGDTLASFSIYVQVRPTEDNTQSFVAAWTTLPLLGTIGFEIDFNKTITVIHGPPAAAALAALNGPFKSNQNYVDGTYTFQYVSDTPFLSGSTSGVADLPTITVTSVYATPQITSFTAKQTAGNDVAFSLEGPGVWPTNPRRIAGRSSTRPASPMKSMSAIILPRAKAWM